MTLFPSFWSRYYLFLLRFFANSILPSSRLRLVLNGTPPGSPLVIFLTRKATFFLITPRAFFLSDALFRPLTRRRTPSMFATYRVTLVDGTMVEICTGADRSSSFSAPPSVLPPFFQALPISRGFFLVTSFPAFQALPLAAKQLRSLDDIQTSSFYRRMPSLYCPFVSTFRLPQWFMTLFFLRSGYAFLLSFFPPTVDVPRRGFVLLLDTAAKRRAFVLQILFLPRIAER